MGGWVPVELKCKYQIVMYISWGGTIDRTLFYLWTVVSWLLFLCSCILLFPWRSLITETCSRASIVARLRSQNGLGQNGFSSVKKAMPCSLLLGTPYPICLESFLKNIYLFIYCLFIYFWLCWVFVAAHGLSLVVASGGYSLLRCVGFSLQWLLLLQSTGSRHAGFSSCGTWAQ